MSTKKIREIVERACRYRWDGATEALSEIEAIEKAAVYIAADMTGGTHDSDLPSLREAVALVERIAEEGT
jgi:hypothetical protein